MDTVISIRRLEYSICVQSLPAFIKVAWKIVEPSVQLQWNWHLDVICHALERITAGENKKLIINVPPGTGKSLILTFWNAWEWTVRPELKYLTYSYNDHNTLRDNRRLRAVVTSRWYRELFWVGSSSRPAINLCSDQNVKVRFETTAGGYRIASSVGGAVGTGEHPDRIVIDDPHKAEEILSGVARDAVENWDRGTISTRIARDPAEVVVMQRLHEGDLSGLRLSNGTECEHVCLPMRYEVNGKWDCACHQVPDKRDPRTIEGELLTPAFPEKRVVEEELRLGPFESSGQLQQRPVPIGGGLVKREWLEIVDVVPVGADYGRGWDTAATENSGDWTAGVKIALCKDIWYICDVIYARTEAADKIILQTTLIDGVYCIIREETEGGGSGKTVIRHHTKMLKGFDFAGVSISKNKVSRFRGFRAQCEAGNVKIVRNPDWNSRYITSICGFPVLKHDDDVDATSCIFNYMALDRKKPVRLLIGTVR